MSLDVFLDRRQTGGSGRLMPKDALATARADIARARLRLESAMQNARIIALEKSQDGMPETEIARRLGLNRMTVRRFLEKL